MRRVFLPCRLTGVSVALMIVVAMTVSGPMAAAKAAHGFKTVSYAGYRLSVPASWPVYRLASDPSRCVRFDQHAVYLGHPGVDQRCPAMARGRTTAVLIEPLDQSTEASGPDVQWLRTSHARPRVPDAVDREAHVAVVPAGVFVTVTYDGDRGLAERMLASGRSTGTTKGTTPRVPTGGGTVPTGKPHKADGPGFDACTAPSTSAMHAWHKKYHAAGIYIGGANRACGDGNLSASWTKSVRGSGWHLIPTYVGLQAPCNKFRNKIKPKYAYAEGKQSAKNAVGHAKHFGMGTGTPIYFDIEGYSHSKTWCKNAVLHFLSGWTRQLRRLHYVSGVYSSVGSAIVDLGRAKQIAKPDGVWYAHWDGKYSTAHDGYLPDSWWNHQRRIKQYRGPHNEKHGKARINIDSDSVNGYVY